MKQHNLSAFCKRLAGFFHVIFAVVTFIGIGFIFLNSNYGRGLDWLSEETFEQSPDFQKKVQSDIISIFDYVKYQSIFESNGEVDYNRVVLRVTSGPGGDRAYTLDDIIKYGKSIGYYMDENDNYALKGTPVHLDEEDNQSLFVQWRCYKSEEELSGPDQSYATLPELSHEILKRFSSYYSIYSRLMSDFTNFYFRLAYYSKNKSIFEVHTNAPEMSDEEMTGMGKYIYFSGASNDLAVKTNFDSTFPSIPAMMTQNNPYNSTDNYLVIGLDTTYKANDDYAKAVLAYGNSRTAFVRGLYLLALGLVGSLITLAYLVIASGHASMRGQPITLYPIDKMVTELLLLLMAAVAFVAMRFAGPLVSKLLHLVIASTYWPRVDVMMSLIFAYFCGLITFFSLVRRYKAETLFKNSYLYRLKEVLSENTFKFRLTASFIFYLSCNIFAITAGAFFILRDGKNILRSIPFIILTLLWILCNLAVFYYMYSNAGQQDKIYEAIEKLASGETSYKVDTAQFSSLEIGLAEAVNRISDGLETALAEQVKSERLKADLITNVSHDIKTPLTSIINYVDLIKREDIEDPTIQKYLEVLEQKSQRLKTLTEDLVEASKASSGNIRLDIADIDLVELVQQTNGEFEDKFVLRHLELVSALPNEVILIEADGRRLWRVLENLYNNAFKYAMEGSRIYVSVEDLGSEVVFAIKNVSTNPLNISADELTERFVRGDVARTTEGSGLGLSIAKSLTQLQGGKFDITIDGDLFKAEVTFAIKN